MGPATAYFHEPALMIGLGGMFVAPTHADLPTALEPALAALQAKGYGRSELSIRELWSLNATATLVTGVAIRYKLDGQELERVGVTYVLQKAGAGWKIAVLITHETEFARHVLG